MKQKVTDSQFIDSWLINGGAQAVANDVGMTVRNVYARRRAIEARTGRKLISEIEQGNKPTLLLPENKTQANLEFLNGTMLVGSDCHYMPDSVSPAHRAFVAAAKKLKPEVICLNGDIFDFASISRHPKMNTRPMPTLQQELEAGQDRCKEIVNASPNSLFVRTLGNHDMRLDVRLANQAPEFAGLISLKTYLPEWLDCVSMMVNDDTVILHKWANGMHAAYNNVMKGLFMNVITGHTHRLHCRPMSSSWRGGETRFGIETGTMAEPSHEAFDYCLDSNKDWQPGFVVLTWKDGRLQYPEFCHVVNENVVFRGSYLL
jgi:hypothetical protein